MRYFFTLVLSTALVSASHAQEPDPLTKLVTEMFRVHGSKTLCLPPTGASVDSIRSSVLTRLRLDGPLENATGEKAAEALWRLYPCPFAPSRPEVRVAKSTDIEGAWIFPKNSQILRRGPRASQGALTGNLAIDCEAVGYFANGELRTVIIAGQNKCPFESAQELEQLRKNPRVSSWNFIRDGRLSITRTDVSDHIEEWDMYTVIGDFDFSGIQFSTGDLIAYARRSKGNIVGASTEFRHLKPLR